SPVRSGLGQFRAAAPATVARQAVRLGPGDWFDTGWPRTTNSRCTAIGRVPHVLPLRPAPDIVPPRRCRDNEPKGNIQGFRYTASTSSVGAAVPPGLLFLLAGVVAGPEQPFAAGQPVAERVAPVAAAAMRLSRNSRLSHLW